MNKPKIDEAIKEVIVSLRFWFNAGHSPSPSTLWDDGETWKQKVDKAFSLLANHDTCELCGHMIHPLCNGGNCQDTPHAAPDADIEADI